MSENTVRLVCGIGAALCAGAAVYLALQQAGVNFAIADYWREAKRMMVEADIGRRVDGE